MIEVKREHLAGLELALDHVGRDQRSILDDLIAQASAAPEQEAVAWQVTGAGGLTVTPQYPSWAEGDARLNIQTLYTHPSAEIERLRAELAESDKCVVRALNERDAGIEEWSGIAVQNGMECDRLRQKLADAQALLRALRPLTLERDDGGRGALRGHIDAFLSATAQHAEGQNNE